MSLSELEKVFQFNHNGYVFDIKRNKRKDCFLSNIVNTNNTEYTEKIIPIKRVFLTLKGAKSHALDMINLNTQNNG